MIFEQWLQMFPEYKTWHQVDQKNLYKKYLRDTWTKNKFKSLSQQELLDITNEAIKSIPKYLVVKKSLIKTYTYMMIRKKYKCPY